MHVGTVQIPDVAANIGRNGTPADGSRHLPFITPLFAGFLPIFLAHRALSFASLARFTTLGGNFDVARVFFVGALSDLWIAWVLALTIGLPLRLMASKRRGAVAGRLRAPAILAVALAAGAHQGYVAFFGFQIVPFHLRYLLDPAFISANGASVLSLHSAVIATIWLPTYLAASKWSWPAALTRRFPLAIGSITALFLLAHNRNIHWRVQWFVPENLSVNFIERLYLHSKTQSHPAAVSEADLSALTRALEFRGTSVRELLAAPGSAATRAEDLDPIALALKMRLHDAVSAGRRPVVAVILMESLRPAETGYLNRHIPPNSSLTPALDALAANGWIFRRAYSSGTVTRSAQEAVFCGHLSGRDTSLMRGQTVTTAKCLPAMASPLGRIHWAWLHGGAPGFDNQRDFWLTQKVPQTMSRDSFSPETPATGWGVGDRTFFQAAAAALADRDREGGFDLQAAMALSVSNHIPWHLPADATSPPAFPPPPSVDHPSYATTAYSDHALGEFVKMLKDSGLWPKTLLIVASDHGNLVPPRNLDFAEGRHEKAELLTHVNLVITGGIAEAEAASAGRHESTDPGAVNLADVGHFLGWLLDIKPDLAFGQHLFSRTRRLPAAVDVEGDLYFPDTGSLISNQAVVSGDPPGLTPAERLGLTHYRLLLRWLYGARPPAGLDP